jgi:MarR family transcriptional regulator, organic hydroperoxide resistance regulator
MSEIQRMPASAIDTFLASFDQLAQAIRRARGARTAAGHDGLTLSQYGLLEPLLTAHTARVRELAHQAGITAPTATRILDTLERRGIVHRTPAQEDRRGVSVSLTERGRKHLSDHHDWLRRRQTDFYEGLDAEERALAPDLMARLAGLIDEIAGGPED